MSRQEMYCSRLTTLELALHRYCTFTMNIFSGMSELFFIRCQWVDDVIHNFFFQIRPHVEAHHRGVWVRAWYNIFTSPLWAVRFWTFNRAFYVCDLWQVIYRLFVGQLKGSFCKMIIGEMDWRTSGVTEKLGQLCPRGLPYEKVIDTRRLAQGV